jgi:hypothetical protein
MDRIWCAALSLTFSLTYTIASMSSAEGKPSFGAYPTAQAGVAVFLRCRWMPLTLAIMECRQSLMSRSMSRAVKQALRNRLSTFASCATAVGAGGRQAIPFDAPSQGKFWRSKKHLRSSDALWYSSRPSQNWSKPVNQNGPWECPDCRFANARQVNTVRADESAGLRKCHVIKQLGGEFKVKTLDAKQATSHNLVSLLLTNTTLCQGC